MMRVDDRAADREAQSHARSRRLAPSPRELFKDRLLLTLGYAGARVTDAYRKVFAYHLGGDLDDGSLRRVLRGVFQQVVEHALDQGRIEFDERQVPRYMHVDAMMDECCVRGLEGASHDFLNRVPMAAQLDLAALDARHFEQVVA